MTNYRLWLLNNQVEAAHLAFKSNSSTTNTTTYQQWKTSKSTSPSTARRTPPSMLSMQDLTIHSWHSFSSTPSTPTTTPYGLWHLPTSSPLIRPSTSGLSTKSLENYVKPSATAFALARSWPQTTTRRP